MHIIGHTLVSFHRTPNWVSQDASGKPLTRDALLAPHERPHLHRHGPLPRSHPRLDVVNEAVATGWRPPANPNGSKSSAKITSSKPTNCPPGQSQAQLYYNEYDYEFRPKCEGVIRLVKNLQAKGVRVDGVGIQGHWFLEYPRMDEIEAYVQLLTQLGVNPMITELDIGMLPFTPWIPRKWTSPPSTRQRRKGATPIPTPCRTPPSRPSRNATPTSSRYSASIAACRPRHLLGRGRPPILAQLPAHHRPAGPPMLFDRRGPAQARLRRHRQDGLRQKLNNPRRAILGRARSPLRAEAFARCRIASRAGDSDTSDMPDTVRCSTPRPSTINQIGGPRGTTRK